MISASNGFDPPGCTLATLISLVEMTASRVQTTLVRHIMKSIGQKRPSCTVDMQGRPWQSRAEINLSTVVSLAGIS